MIALGLLLLWGVDLREAIRQGNLEAVRSAIASGADVNATDQLGAAPLLDAVWNGQTEVVKMLLDAGAQVNGIHREAGSTPLFYAAMKNNAAMAQLLLDRGANARAANRFPSSPKCKPKSSVVRVPE